MEQMSIQALRRQGFTVEECPYEGGREIVISRNGKTLSVACSAGGLLDVLEAGEIMPLYTGTDEQIAAKVVADFFRGDKR